MAVDIRQHNTEDLSKEKNDGFNALTDQLLSRYEQGDVIGYEPIREWVIRRIERRDTQETTPYILLDDYFPAYLYTEVEALKKMFQDWKIPSSDRDILKRLRAKKATQLEKQYILLLYAQALMGDPLQIRGSDPLAKIQTALESLTFVPPNDSDDPYEHFRRHLHKIKAVLGNLFSRRK